MATSGTRIALSLLVGGMIVVGLGFVAEPGWATDQTLTVQIKPGGGEGAGFGVVLWGETSHLTVTLNTPTGSSIIIVQPTTIRSSGEFLWNWTSIGDTSETAEAIGIGRDDDHAVGFEGKYATTTPGGTGPNRFDVAVADVRIAGHNAEPTDDDALYMPASDDPGVPLDAGAINVTVTLQASNLAPDPAGKLTFTWTDTGIDHLAYNGNAIGNGDSIDVPRAGLTNAAIEIWTTVDFTATDTITAEFAWRSGFVAQNATANKAKDNVALAPVPGATITVYRPLHGANGSYAPFAKTAVARADRKDEVRGPGIRINSDDDDGDGFADYLIPGPTNNERDLIEVLLQRDSVTDAFKLRRNTAAIKVWTTSNKVGEITFPNANNSETNNLPFPAGVKSLTLWVEWANPNHGTADLTIFHAATLKHWDTVTFHTFHSILIFLGGRGQVPTDPPNPSHGAFIVSVEMYKRGYDAWMYNQNSVRVLPFPIGTGAPYNEVDVATRAVLGRSVQNVGVYGYSWGGGATFDMVNALRTRLAINVAFSGYCDAIERATGFSETRLPPGTAFHFNYYETRDWPLHGAATAGLAVPPNVQVDATGWFPRVKHHNIDDDRRTVDAAISNLLAKVPTP